MNKATTITPGSIVIVPSGTSQRPCPALVDRQDPRDGSLLVRTKRCPTKAELKRGDYTWWVKSTKRFPISQVIRVESTPDPDHQS